ncbi:MAG: hypothetical protein WCC80_15075, partial [Pseudolabrys sp.]
KVPSISGRVVNGLGFILDIRGDSVSISGGEGLRNAPWQKECIGNVTPVHDNSALAVARVTRTREQFATSQWGS